jgi:uncharacterized protein involved in exopolysaccharide biosynthesis
VNSRQHLQSDADHDFDFIELCGVVWAQKRLVAITTVIGTLVALVLAIIAIPSFRAEIVVTIVEDSSIGGAQSLASQFGGLASLAGVNLGGGGQERENQAVLESRHLIEEFVKTDGVLDAMQRNAKQPAHPWMVVEKFKRNVLKITEEKMKGTTTISMEWTDPVTAARWANDFVALANELVRTKARNDASRNIDYLNQQVAKTNVVELQRVMYSLIESETKTLMLANARSEYAFTVVDPAAVPEVRVSPKRTLMVASGFAIGLFIGVFIAWMRNKFARRRALD